MVGATSVGKFGSHEISSIEASAAKGSIHLGIITLDSRESDNRTTGAIPRAGREAYLGQHLAEYEEPAEAHATNAMVERREDCPACDRTDAGISQVVGKHGKSQSFLDPVMQLAPPMPR